MSILKSLNEKLRDQIHVTLTLRSDLEFEVKETDLKINY